MQEPAYRWLKTYFQKKKKEKNFDLGLIFRGWLHDNQGGEHAWHGIGPLTEN